MGRLVYNVGMTPEPSDMDTRTDPSPDEVQEALQAYGTLTEEGLVKALRASKAQQDALEQLIEAHYRPLVQGLLDAGKVEEARWVVAHRVPDSVSRVFLLDTVRQHQKMLAMTPIGQA